MVEGRHDLLRALCKLELDANVKSSNTRLLDVVRPSQILSLLHTSTHAWSAERLLDV